MGISSWHFVWQAAVKHIRQAVERIKNTLKRERVELDLMELELAKRDVMMGGLRSP